MLLLLNPQQTLEFPSFFHFGIFFAACKHGGSSTVIKWFQNCGNRRAPMDFLNTFFMLKMRAELCQGRFPKRLSATSQSTVQPQSIGPHVIVHYSIPTVFGYRAPQHFYPTIVTSWSCQYLDDDRRKLLRSQHKLPGKYRVVSKIGSQY